MTRRVEEVKDVAPAELARVIAQFKAAGAKVTTTKQVDGNWTVTAVFES